MYGNAYLKYVLAGPATHTNIKDNAGNTNGIYLYSFFTINATNKKKYTYPTKPMFTNNPNIGI